MEIQERPSNEEEKQNQEEEEFDEEDEEEKEGDKKHQEKVESKKETKEENKENQIDIKTEKKEEENQINSEKAEEQKENKEIKEENKIPEKPTDNEKAENNEKNNEKVEDNKIINEDKKDENEEEQEESSSSYILRYVRKSNEPRESAYDKELIKSKKCLYMIEFKIIKGKTEKYLLVYCHEIAAIYFDEIYEKKYSLKDLYKENRHFRIFKLHIKISFFDKDNEVILNIPKKDITDKERIRLLPEFLKEIQIKINHLEDDNKKLKNEYKNMGENSVGGSGIGDDDFFGEKEKKNKIKGYKKKNVKK